MGEEASEVVVRHAEPADVHFARAASELIERASHDNDIATREPELLEHKVRTGRAAVALIVEPDGAERLVGFGFFSDWEGGRFVSHSGLVVAPELRGHGVGRRLKSCLIEASERMFPDATTMSLTSSPPVKAMNLSLGFEVVPFDKMTKDQGFWDGCLTCRNYEQAKSEGKRCCCEGMIRPPRRT